MDIYINELLHFAESELWNIKVKFNIYNGYDDPRELFADENRREELNTQWLFWRHERGHLKVGNIAVCLARIGGDSWLLTTIKKVTRELGVYDGINYEGEELSEYKKYYGRLVVRFHKSDRSTFRIYGGIHHEMTVEQLLPDVYSGEEFPGYDNVCVSYKQLSSVLAGKRDWIAALENQKAVYLITDKAEGKFYVGSATADNGMLLTRWKNYVDNGHGGNKELKRIVAEKGFGYIKENFQYTILENYNARIDDEFILSRERYWKKVLRTRDFGYNDN